MTNEPNVDSFIFSLSCSRSAGRGRTVEPPPARSSPQCEPHGEPVRIAPRPSSPALCQSNAKGYLLPDFYSGCATGKSGRFTEGLLLRRSHLCGFRSSCDGQEACSDV